jgi:hypothetical protein
MKSKKITFFERIRSPYSWIVLLSLLPFLTKAQTVTWTTFGQTNGLEENALYAVESTATARVSKIENLTGTPTYTEVYRGNTGWSTAYPTTTPGLTTIAMGWYNGSLVMYHWDWSSRALATINDNNYVPVRRVVPGQDNAETLPYPVPISNPPGAGGTAELYRSAWSGGEINQLTGELYFSGCEDTYLGWTGSAGGSTTRTSPFTMMKYNITTGNYVRASGVIAKTPADSILVDGKFVMSDMAIDAEGNAYILVGNDGSDRYLVKVEPENVNGLPWYYSVVKKLGSGMSGEIYGMAFVDGTLYAAYGSLYAIDVFSGTVTNKGTLPYTAFDLASCQTAPVIRGKIFNDRNGDGIISHEDSLSACPGVTIEIYDKNKAYLGSTQTNASGEFNFLCKLNSPNDGLTNYYLRVKRPYIKTYNAAGTAIIDSVQAVQTWASAEDATGYKTVAYTSKWNGTSWNKDLPMTVSGPTPGAKGLLATDPNTSVLDNAMIYSNVNIQGSQQVAKVYFGLTGFSDRGDAPYSATTNDGKPFKSTIALGGPAQLALKDSTNNYFLYMGNSVSGTFTGNYNNTVPEIAAPVDAASTDANDNGVFIVTPTGLRPFTDGIIELKQTDGYAAPTYTFKVKVSGSERSRGYLNVWTSRNFGSGATGAIGVQRILTNVRDGMTGDTDGTVNDTVTFTYIPPNGTAITNAGNNPTYMRFRLSSRPLGTGTDAVNYNGNPGSGDSDMWGNYGEIEDYYYSIKKLQKPITIYWPNSSIVTYGDSLGTAIWTPPGASDPPGTFEFLDGYTTYPKVNREYIMQYTPSVDSYSSETKLIPVKVRERVLSVEPLAKIFDKYYDGNTIAQVCSISFINLAFDDELIIGDHYTALANFNNSAVGNNKPVTVNNLDLTGAELSLHYSLAALSFTDMPTGTASILAASGNTRKPGEGVVIGDMSPAGIDSVMNYSILYLQSGTRGLQLPRINNSGIDVLSGHFLNSQAEEAEATGLIFYNSTGTVARLQVWLKSAPYGNSWFILEADTIPSSETNSPIETAPTTPGDAIIGSTGDAAAYATLQLNSTTTGLRLPDIAAEGTMKTMGALLLKDGAKANGLLTVYADTTLAFWNGSGWKEIDMQHVAHASSTTEPKPAINGVTIGAQRDPHFFSQLELVSSNKGMRLPCLTTAKRNGLFPSSGNATAGGTVIYNSDSKSIEYYTGQIWMRVRSAKPLFK